MAEKSQADPVTHGEMQDELRRIRIAVLMIAERLGRDHLGRPSLREILDLLTPPEDRRPERTVERPDEP